MPADLGARYSYRDAARLMQAFLPCTLQNHATIRNRLGRVAEELETKDHDASEPEQLCFEFSDSADESLFSWTLRMLDLPHTIRNAALMLWWARLKGQPVKPGDLAVSLQVQTGHLEAFEV